MKKRILLLLILGISILYCICAVQFYYVCRHSVAAYAMKEADSFCGFMNSNSLFYIELFTIYLFNLLAYILFHWYSARVKRENEELQEHMLQEIKDLENRLSIKQMQPHFFYNVLSAIREIVLEDPQVGSDLIYDFTIHLRNCIKSMSSDQLITLRMEAENIRAYVNIEEIRLFYSFHVDYQLETDDFLVPPLSIQPFIENAIRHGIKHMDNGEGCISIHSYEQEHCYCIRIQDNGQGFDFDQIEKEVKSGQRDSTGLQNSIKRIQNLTGGTVKVDSQPGYGTKISICIPKMRPDNENDSC